MLVFLCTMVGIICLAAGLILGIGITGLILNTPARQARRTQKLLMCPCGHSLAFHDDEDGSCHAACHCQHYQGVSLSAIEDAQERAR